MVEPTHLAAILLSTGAAIAQAANQLFIRKGTEDGRVADAVIVVMLVNLALLLPLVGLRYYPDYGLTRRAWVAFAAAGLLGTLLGRVFLYTSIERLGASRTSPIVSSNALVATGLGVVVLGETLTPLHALGIVLIVGGVAAIAWETSHENPDDLPRRELLVGLAIPLGAALAFGGEPVVANLGFAEGTPAPVGLAVKTVAATLGFALYLRWRGALPGAAVLRSADVRWYGLAGVASTLFLLGYYGSLAIAPVNVVVPINITQTLYVVVLSALFMPERLERVSWQLVAAAATVVAGAVLVTVAG